MLSEDNTELLAISACGACIDGGTHYVISAVQVA